MWRARFGRGFGPVVRQTAKWMNIIFVNNQLDAQLFFMYVYFYSLHVSGSLVPIIRRINCINTTSSIWPYMTVWCLGFPAHQTVIYTEWHIPDVVLIKLILLMMGTWLSETRIEINIHEKEMWVKLVIYNYYTEIHGQQNIKYTCMFGLFNTTRSI